MIHVNPSRAQTRRACDRCHQAKIKCVVEGNRCCQRCQRTNAACTFSPPTGKGRQQQQQQSQGRDSLSNPSDGGVDTHPNVNGWADMDIDWALPLETSPQAIYGLEALHTDLGLDAGQHVAPFIPGQFHFDEEEPDHDHDTRLAASSGRSAVRDAFVIPTVLSSPRKEADGDSGSGSGGEKLTSPVFWVDKVTQLNVQFTQHLQSIPRVNTDSLDHEDRDGEIPPPSKTHDSDHTFHLCESFIELLSTLCSKHKDEDSDDTAASLFLDEASYLIVFSTYIRFLETHDTVFRYLLACLDHHRDESTTTGSCFYLPKLTMGSFSLARRSETRPLLFVNLMESMLTRATHLVSRLLFAKDPSGRRRGSQACFAELPPIIEPELALRAITSRETAVLNLIERIKARLLRLG